MQKIGFLGMGVMGLPMAKNVVQKCGLPVLGYDVVQQQMDAFREAGGIPVSDPAEIYKACDVILQILPTHPIIRNSVEQAIQYGKPGASREEVIQAAKQAGAHDFTQELSNGYDTFVGERGVKLSGGQKQRISIARVFLKNPPILILDEATSALDNESERLVQQSLEKLARGRTVFTIAHRLTTIRGADTIWVLTENGVEEMGSHAELMKKGGLYAHLYEMYTEKGEETA